MLAARSGTYSCRVRPVSPYGETNGTIYASNNATAVQAGLDTLGAAGGTLQISGTCSGTTNRGGSSQTASIPTLNSGATLTLQGGWNSTFTSQNRVTYPAVLNAAAGGRVVLAAGTTGTLVITDITLAAGWTTGAEGGALKTAMTTSLSYVTVSSSTSKDYGGGIYASASLTLDSSTVSGNVAGSVQGMQGLGYGGGIYAASTLELYNTTVSGNTCAAGSLAQGGGVFAYSGATISNSHITGNSAYRGGGLYVRSGTASITTVEFSGNSASGSSGSDDNGGGIYLEGGSISASGATVASNTAANDGAGIYAAAGTVSLTNTSVNGNEASGDGGGIATAGAVPVSAGGASCLIANNRATANGAGIYAGKVTLSSGCQVAGNDAASGGGIYLFDAGAQTSTLSNIQIYGNTATASGGGIYVTGASQSLTLSTSPVTENEAVNGAGIYGSGGTLTVTDTRLGANLASGNGGALFISGATLSLSRATLDNNKAVAGSAIAQDSTAASTVVNCTISGNSVYTTGRTIQETDIGAVYVNGGSMMLKHATVTMNMAPNGSGLNFAAGAVTVKNSIIAGNFDSSYFPDKDVKVGTGLTLTSQGGNVVGAGDTGSFNQTGDLFGQTVAEVNLDTLKNNGGATYTHALLERAAWPSTRSLHVIPQ
jgi:fibronectin-binding autotransporter adhesin